MSEFMEYFHPSAEPAQPEQFCAAAMQASDGRFYNRDTADGTPVRVAAPEGTAQHVLELIEGGRFQNRDGTLTDAANQSISAFIRQARFFQSNAGRAAELQWHLRRHTDDPHLTVEHRPRQLTDNSATGSPIPEAVILRVGGVRRVVPFGK